MKTTTHHWTLDEPFLARGPGAESAVSRLDALCQSPEWQYNDLDGHEHHTETPWLPQDDAVITAALTTLGHGSPSRSEWDRVIQAAAVTLCRSRPQTERRMKLLANGALRPAVVPGTHSEERFRTRRRQALGRR